MTNTTSTSAFMKRLGITGHVTTTNGIRLHITRVRNRMALKERDLVDQRAFIDLTTYTANCYTFADSFTPGQCLSESRNVQRSLAPIARLAKIAGVTGEETIPKNRNAVPRRPITQAHELASALSEAGMRSVLFEGTSLILDERILGRLSGVPDTAPYVVSIRPLPTNAKWGKTFGTAKELGRLCEGVEVHLQVVGEDHAPGHGAMLIHTAENVLAELFGNTWNR